MKKKNKKKLEKKQHWTRKDVAKYLGKSIHTIYSYKAKGLIFTLAGTINKDDLFRWLESTKSTSVALVI